MEPRRIEWGSRLDTQYRCVIARPPHFIYEQLADGSWITRDATPEELEAFERSRITPAGSTFYDEFTKFMEEQEAQKAQDSAFQNHYL